MISNQKIVFSWLASAIQSLSLASLCSAGLPVSAAEQVPLLLAETEHGQADVALYLVSEKLDGVRAFWDGQIFRSRNGNLINAPAWFVAGFPSQPLDGELWIGRGLFERLSATVRKQTPNDAEWREISYRVFELPNGLGSFRERDRELRRMVAEAGVPWLVAVEQFEVQERRTLDRKLDEIVRAGGEGLMLHRADASYITGRSDALLKMKRWNDAEAVVIGHQPGKGRNAGRLGALRVRMANGVEFVLGTGLSDALRNSPPAVGTIITFRYRELTSRGLPRFASFHRVADF